MRAPIACLYVLIAALYGAGCADQGAAPAASPLARASGVYESGLEPDYGSIGGVSGPETQVLFDMWAIRLRISPTGRWERQTVIRVLGGDRQVSIDRGTGTVSVNDAELIFSGLGWMGTRLEYATEWRASLVAEDCWPHLVLRDGRRLWRVDAIGDVARGNSAPLVGEYVMVRRVDLGRARRTLDHIAAIGSVTEGRLTLEERNLKLTVTVGTYDEGRRVGSHQFDYTATWRLEGDRLLVEGLRGPESDTVGLVFHTLALGGSPPGLELWASHWTFRRIGGLPKDK